MVRRQRGTSSREVEVLGRTVEVLRKRSGGGRLRRLEVYLYEDLLVRLSLCSDGGVGFLFRVMLEFADKEGMFRVHGIYGDQICAALGMERQGLMRRLKELKDLGIVSRPTRGIFQIDRGDMAVVEVETVKKKRKHGRNKVLHHLVQRKD